MAVAAWRSRAAPLMTSAEQAAGRAALVVLIKSQNGQNTSNAQPVGSHSLAHTHVLHVTGMGHLLCGKPLHMLDSVPFVGTSGRKTAPLGLKVKISSLIPL